MLCKVLRFHGGHYEECRLLGYKNPVRTSQGTHYVSATEFSQLVLCKVFSRWSLRRMPSSGMVRRAALVRTYLSEERSASIIRVTRIGELGTTLAVTTYETSETGRLLCCHAPHDIGLLFLNQ
jgi:hypothetical protein